MDARLFRAEMSYDPFGRQSRWIFPSKTQIYTADQSDYEEYRYDPAGNRTWFRKRDGRVLTFTYDALNRVVVKDVPEFGLDVRYSYDLRGLQTGAWFTGTGHGVYNGYDGFGRISSTTSTMGGVTRTISHLFDRDGREAELTLPDGFKFWFERDGLGRMTKARQGAWGTSGPVMASFGYNAKGLPQSFTRGSGSATTYGYDSALRLNLLTDTFAGGTGNVATGFTYNPASQLRTEARDNDAYAWRGSVPVSRTYWVNGQNQYLQTASNGAVSATFTHDPNGNLTGDGSTNYTYDSENRLITASGAKTATLAYDPLGRLWQVTGASGTTQFLHDGDELVAEYSPQGNVLRRYVHGDAADDPLFWFEGFDLTHARFPHGDRKGSIVATADGTGALRWINTYDEYGIPGGLNQGRFQYTGQAWLAELGMYHYKARIYSPTLGRFLQTDPIGYDDQINLYAYVANDPVNGSDPDGMCGRRYEDGTCKVKVDPKTGAAGIEAGKAMEARLNHYDSAMNALDPKLRIAVTSDAGNVLGTITGRQLRKAWNRQKFSITSKRFKNSGLGGSLPGSTRMNVRAVTSYRDSAIKRGKTAGDGLDTLLFHELGHSMDPGRQIAKDNPVRRGQPNAVSEHAANVQGRAIANSVGGSFMCEMPGLYGC